MNERIYFITSFLILFLFILIWAYFKDYNGITILGKIAKLIFHWKFWKLWYNNKKLKEKGVKNDWKISSNGLVTIWKI